MPQGLTAQQQKAIDERLQELAQGFRPTTTYDPAIKQAQAVEFIAYAVGELLKEERSSCAAVEAAAKAR